MKTSALLTSMENPLGRAIGNSVEVIEAIDCLKGKGPCDLFEITCALGMCRKSHICTFHILKDVKFTENVNEHFTIPNSNINIEI